MSCVLSRFLVVILICQRNSQTRTVETTELYPVPVHTTWVHIGIDFIGPIFPISASGNRYILTLTNYFSKWVEVVPMETTERSIWCSQHPLYRLDCHHIFIPGPVFNSLLFATATIDYYENGPAKSAHI